MPRTTTVVSRPGFIADAHSIDRYPTGLQIDWANVSQTDAEGRKFLLAGTSVGTLAAGGKLRPRVVTTNPAIGLLETNAYEDDRNAAVTGYGVIIGGAVYENLLPDATGGPPATLPAAIKTELQTAGVGTGFAFFTYADTRA